VKTWEGVAEKQKTARRAPQALYSELDIVLRTARDLLTEDVAKIVIDDREEHARLMQFVEAFMPERAGDIELYQGADPIFDEFGIEDEIARSLSRKVPLPSGGYLIIDQAEALTAIDVNTGRFTGKGKDVEETIFQTNLEAAKEITYQLRFRNIGGIIVLDFIEDDLREGLDAISEVEAHFTDSLDTLRADRVTPIKLLDAAEDFRVLNRIEYLMVVVAQLRRRLSQAAGKMRERAPR
jgi:Rne/Rng family ribonuclease